MRLKKETKVFTHKLFANKYYTYTYVDVSLSLYINICVCVCVCVCVYMEVNNGM